MNNPKFPKHFHDHLAHLEVGHPTNLFKLPLYDSGVDYNTNAESYSDFLATYTTYFFSWTEKLVNQLLRRNFKVEDTNSIEFIKEGDWINNGKCEPCNIDDIVKILSNVKISKQFITVSLDYLKSFDLYNSITIKDDGIFSPDYWKIIQAIDKEIKNIYNELQRLELKLDQFIEETNNRFDKLDGTLQKILDNLFEAGAITTNDKDTYEFISGVHLAYGNVNHYITSETSGKYIRTNKENTDTSIMGAE